MAKAKTIDSLECGASAAKTAAELLRVRLDEILGFHSAAIEPDGIDGVHDMRVASRRFRSALKDFAPLFDKKAVKSLKNHAKGLADALGDIRDNDVAVEALGPMRERAPNEAITHGIGLLIESRRAQRSEALATFVEHASLDHLTRLRSDIDDALGPVGDGKDMPQTFRDFGAEAIERAVEKFLSRAEGIYEPFNDKVLHELRLSAKRVRYALELFDDCWGGELKPFAKHFSKMQSSLGKVHDSAEWLIYLSETIREDSSLDRRTAAWLISEFVTLRTTEYLKALDLWNEWLTADLGSKLTSALEINLNAQLTQE